MKEERANKNFQVKRENLFKKLKETFGDQNIVIFRRQKKNRDGVPSDDAFRGSIYRGVSKNKSKWQVRLNKLHKLPLDDDYGEFQEDVCWSDR